MNKYRVAIAGAGFGVEHAAAYASVPQTAVVALVEPAHDRRAPFLDRFQQVNLYDHFEEMLVQEHPDIVSICTPHYLHAPLTIAAADAGVRAIYVEKPMAMHLGEADAMIAACEQSGTLLVVGHQRRLGPAWVTAKAMLEAGELGDINLVHTAWNCWKLPWQYEFSGGGALMYLGTHSLDIFRLWLGEFAWVQGQVERNDPAFTIETNTRAYLMSQRGVPAILETGENTLGNVTDILCSRGRLSVTDEHLGVLRAGGGQWQDIPLPFPADVPDDQRWTYPIREMVKGIVRWCDTGAPHPVGYTEGRAALELAMAIYQSHRMASQITLPFNEQYSPLQCMVAAGEF